MAAYRFTPKLKLQINADNIFNRHYYSTVYYNEKQWFVGESRRVLFTIDHRF